MKREEEGESECLSRRRSYSKVREIEWEEKEEWIRLDWSGVEWSRVEWSGLDRSGWIRLEWSGLDWIRLIRSE